MKSLFKSTLSKITKENATSKQIELLDLVVRHYQFVPHLQQNMANCPPLLQSYLEGIVSFRKQSGFTFIEQEIIFLTISHFNDCSYCISSHSMIGNIHGNIPIKVINQIF